MKKSKIKVKREQSEKCVCGGIYMFKIKNIYFSYVS